MGMFKCRCNYVQKSLCYTQIFYSLSLSSWKTFKGCLKDGYQLWCNKAPFVVFSEMRKQMSEVHKSMNLPNSLSLSHESIANKIMFSRDKAETY